VPPTPQAQLTDGSVAYIWTGDRWMQSPDGIKGHEPQFWAPLSFEDDGEISRVSWVDSFELDIAVQ
jgi:hypothetical protein